MTWKMADDNGLSRQTKFHHFSKSFFNQSRTAHAWMFVQAHNTNNKPDQSRFPSAEQSSGESRTWLADLAGTRQSLFGE
jgi:hypothetical protein